MSANARSAKRHWPRGVAIIHEDRDILVVEKPSGLLTIGTDRIREETLYYKLTDYVRKGNAKSKERIFVVHRLDREASGILVFARSEQAKMTLQDHWDEAEKKYLAIVHGQVTPKAGTITSYLAENQAHMVYSTVNTAKGKLSHTAYRVVKEKGELSLLEINLLSGRKHQIRVHLADKGHPIIGDRKYGSAGASPNRVPAKSHVNRHAKSRKHFDDKSHKRLALHAISLSFNHPFTRQRVTFETNIPKYFNDLIGPASKAPNKNRPGAPE
jgi:RluA family pseudouridine synthase